MHVLSDVVLKFGPPFSPTPMIKCFFNGMKSMDGKA